MEENIKNINAKIQAFRRRYYLNFFIRGGALTLALLLLYFLIISLVEHTVWMGQLLRFTTLLSMVVLFVFCLIVFLKKPLTWWFYRKGLSKEESAKIVGSFFPSVNDQLLNLIQLAGHKNRTSLLEASIRQKAQGVEGIAFEQAVNLRKNRRYLWLAVMPAGIILAFLLTTPAMLTQSAKRIVRFDQVFSPPMPFSFQLRNESMDAFIGEDFTLNLRLAGTALPTAVYIQKGNQLFKMDALSTSDYTYTFKKIRQAIAFQFEAGGFRSNTHHINLAHRPELTQLRISFDFPDYLSLHNKQLLNTGNFEVPEGTNVVWQIGAKNTSLAKIKFASSGVESPMASGGQEHTSFTSSRFIYEPEKYWIALENEKAKNKKRIAYAMAVIKDQYPKITVRQLADSVSFGTLLLGGQLTDDYGITALALHYQKELGVRGEKNYTIPIAVKKSPQQHFLYQWQLDSLHLGLGEKIHYFLEVWDNDGVNGHKSTRSSVYTFISPSREEIKMNINNAQKRAQSSLRQGMKTTKELGAIIDKARQELRGKKVAEWRDKKLLDDIFRKKDSLYKSIEQLQKRQELLNKKREAFLEQDEHIVEKAKQIQKLMDELLDEKTKALFEELNKLLNENADIEQVKDVLDRMDKKGTDLENAFKRMMELLDHFRFDTTLEQTIENLKDQIEEQEELLEETAKEEGEKQGKPDSMKQQRQKEAPGNDNKATAPSNRPDKDLAEKQKALSGKSKKLKKEMGELKEMGKKVGRDAGLPSPQEVGEVTESQEKSEQSLEENNEEKATKWQKDALDKMREMKKRLKKMRDAMQMTIDNENLEALRHILHGLIKLSYDQEALIKGFQQTQQSDPKYGKLGLQQLNIKSDFKVLKDSLLRLAERDPFIGSAIVREVGDLSDHLNKALVNLQEGKQQGGRAEMQWSMTRVNNLALMLDAHFDMMKNAKTRAGKGKKGQGKPSLSEMQKQLNQQIRELKKSGKMGRPLSEGLAKMAAEQERIRKAFQRMQQMLEKKGGKMGKQGLSHKMEETEMDLLNKRITQQTLERQKEILSRLLDAEKATREQGLDEERKGTTAKEYEKKLPGIFEQYLKLKQKEVELLKTVPPKLNPYYKKEVSLYFDRINSTKL